MKQQKEEFRLLYCGAVTRNDLHGAESLLQKLRHSASQEIVITVFTA